MTLVRISMKHLTLTSLANKIGIRYFRDAGLSNTEMTLTILENYLFNCASLEMANSSANISQMRIVEFINESYREVSLSIEYLLAAVD
jgi:hypothetical protein